MSGWTTNTGIVVKLESEEALIASDIKNTIGVEFTSAILGVIDGAGQTLGDC